MNGMESTVYVVMFGDFIHGSRQLMQVNDWPYNNECAEYVPQPEIFRAEAVSNASAFQLAADAVGDAMEPYKVPDPNRNPPH